MLTKQQGKEIGPAVYVHAYTQGCGVCVCFACVMVGRLKSDQRKPSQEGEIWRKGILL